uniref:Probable UDP-N-acetylglucosamine--peptide N-acetylglucosaminyltransferase SPINDLY n=1 Tax=Amorphochlora amoebiformis TaxID=1561963 RepID=A0A7S0GQR6_9EUKA|mmetsp:Transcript_11858/g.18842  ORF Transcript_11858/g.18842 Transcript_11858/m.18842 type:complete len:1008 (+) Transcript_11858:101-3124(+)
MKSREESGGRLFADLGSTEIKSENRQDQQKLSRRFAAEARLHSLSSKFSKAMDMWDAVLHLNPNDPEALNQRGMCLMRLGRAAEAMAHYNRALEIDPRHWSAHNNRGVLFKEMGDLQNAIKAYSAALECGPTESVAGSNIAMALTDYGTQLKLQGHIDSALAYYGKALEYNPNFAPAHFDIGVIFSRLGRYRDALRAYNEALRCNPNYVQALCNIGVMYKNASNLEAAIEYYKRALVVDPNFEIARSNLTIAYTDLGTRMKNQGKVRDGIKWYKKALVYNPKYPDAWYNLGVACATVGDLENALVYYEIAATFNPMCAEAYNNQGVIHKELGNLQKSIECYTKALEVNPNFALTLNNLGVIYTSLGKIQRAYRYCLHAVSANPQYAEAFNNLGVLFRDEGDIKQAISSYDRSLQIDPRSQNAGQNRLLAMNSLIPEQLDFKVSSLAEYVYEEHVKWGMFFQSMYHPYTSWNNDITTGHERKLVIGYISGDFFTHSVSYFIELPLKLADDTQVMNICYSNVARPDSRTAKFKTIAHKWVEIYGKSTEKVAEMVREDKVDILVELTGHTAGNRLDVMALKPAPIQVTWIGYPNTTGLTTIDYRFSDAKVDPPDTKQQFSEKLVRLPNTFLCYSPSEIAPDVNHTPALKNGFITFGSFNNFAKCNHRVLDLWARILKAVPSSRLLMKCKPFACEAMQQKVLSRFQSLGINASRITLFPLFPTTKEHLALYSLVDISIDTFPYAGTTTTCEAMYMGVPVITLGTAKGEDDNHAHNVGVTLLSHIPSLRPYITRSQDDYVNAAVQLASDVKALDRIRMNLRKDMLASPLCDGKPFVKNLESLYHKIWYDYCKRATQRETKTPTPLHLPGSTASQYKYKLLQPSRKSNISNASAGTLDGKNGKTNTKNAPSKSPDQPKASTSNTNGKAEKKPEKLADKLENKLASGSSAADVKLDFDRRGQGNTMPIRRRNSDDKMRIEHPVGSGRHENKWTGETNIKNGRDMSMQTEGKASR